MTSDYYRGLNFMQPTFETVIPERRTNLRAPLFRFPAIDRITGSRSRQSKHSAPKEKPQLLISRHLRKRSLLRKEMSLPPLCPGATMKIRQLALAILLPFVLGAADYYVSSTGNDDGDGSQNTPSKHSSTPSQSSPGDTCFLQSGVYRETITEIPSGEPKTNNHQGRSKQQPRITTCDKVTTKWTKVNGDIWIANVDWSLGKHSQLFVNGKHYWRARYQIIDDIPQLENCRL